LEFPVLCVELTFLGLSPTPTTPTQVTTAATTVAANLPPGLFSNDYTPFAPANATGGARDTSSTHSASSFLGRLLSGGPNSTKDVIPEPLHQLPQAARLPAPSVAPVHQNLPLIPQVIVNPSVAKLLKRKASAVPAPAKVPRAASVPPAPAVAPATPRVVRQPVSAAPLVQQVAASPPNPASHCATDCVWRFEQ
jgi:hypothetical protein